MELEEGISLGGLGMARHVGTFQPGLDSNAATVADVMGVPVDIIIALLLLLSMTHPRRHGMYVMSQAMLLYFFFV